MPHINHRRGDTRRRSKQTNDRYWIHIGWWNRQANRIFRTAIRQALRNLRAEGFEPDRCEDFVFPFQEEIDDYYNYD